MKDFKAKADLIWRVADLLRGDYKQSDYGKVILPMTVLRRLDCVLAKSKDKVLKYLPKVDSLKESAKDIALNKVAGFNFHNRSKFDFDKLIADSENVAINLRNFINGFSSSAREIIEYFNFDDNIEYNLSKFMQELILKKVNRNFKNINILNPRLESYLTRSTKGLINNKLDYDNFLQSAIGR